jgi:2,3-diketo-5-methylthio-1-phosphopentane phosphatase
MNTNKTFKIFVDFDGTITKKDVGEILFLQFGNAEKAKEIVQDWIDRKINSRESWRLLCRTIEKLDKNEFDRFIDSQEIDESFKTFVDYCNADKHEIRIVSDGLDYYIDRILNRNGLSFVERFSNKLAFDDNGGFYPEFPYTDEECDRCANCKRNHIINYSGDEDYTVYIGDGYSDLCPAQYCDFIFAKGSLLRYCEINRITYFPFENFIDVINKLNELAARKRLKKRFQAQLKRKEVYIQG